MNNKTLVAGLNFRGDSPSARLEAALEAEYLKERKASGEVTKHTFAPSSIGGYAGACPRYWYLRFDGAMSVDTTNAKSLAIMKSGRDAHERVEGLFESMGILLEKEIEIKLEDPPIRGYLDIIIEWEGHKTVGEIKTTTEDIWNFRKTSRKPSPQHLLQLLIYMRATGIDRGFIYYENRNTLQFLIVPIKMTPENEAILEDALGWLRRVRKAWEDQTMPQPVYQKRNKICKECPVFDACWSQEKGDLFIPKFGAHND